MPDFASDAFNVFIEFMTSVMTVSQWTLFIVGILSLWAGYILKEALSSTLMATAFFPFFLLGGLISRHLFIEYGIFISSNKDANLILATGAGLIVSLVVMTIFVRLYFYLSRISQRSTRYRSGNEA
jgi:hypothetical protein